MKAPIRNLLAAMLLMAFSLQSHAQGTLIDQESATAPISPFQSGVDGLNLSDEQSENLAQSFIPSLSAIDFIALEFEPGTDSATVKVNLYEGSPSITDQTLIATTTAVTMPSGFVNDGLGLAGVEGFYFSTPVILTPGDDYYFEPAVVSGGAGWSFVTIINDTYPNGELFADGYPFVNTTDMWFQEGINAVPEPTTLALIVVGGSLVLSSNIISKQNAVL